MKKLILATALAVSTSLACAAPVLAEVSPAPTSFTYSTTGDFWHMTGTGFGDVTAELIAVDLFVPSSGGSTSGCEAADFAGFAAGSIALIQRGTCTFAIKAANAEAAGAAAVLIFNEGNNAARMDVIVGTLNPSSSNLVVFGTSFAVGDLLRNGVSNGPTGVTARVAFAPEDLAVPEPGSLVLAGLGLLGFAAARRRAS